MNRTKPWLRLQHSLQLTGGPLAYRQGGSDVYLGGQLVCLSHAGQVSGVVNGGSRRRAWAGTGAQAGPFLWVQRQA